ncbi:MAG: hypothetical protein NWR43_01935, partial [Alphaproteobacteria bacterium]|nr:hypothetical protein [Alphaproteobacteria bacterium]
VGMTHQSDLQLEHCSKFGYVDPNVNVKSDGTKASGNRVIQEQTENTMVSEEEIKRKFKEDLNNAIEKKIKKSDKADFAGWLLVSFEFGDYTLNIQCIKDVLSKTTVRSEGFSKIYVVGSPWEGYESLVYEMK